MNGLEMFTKVASDQWTKEAAISNKVLYPLAGIGAGVTLAGSLYGAYQLARHNVEAHTGKTIKQLDRIANKQSQK